MSRAHEHGQPVVLSNWAYTSLGDLIVLFTEGGAPPQRDFDLWLDRLAARDYTRVLVYANGGEPSSVQRLQAARRFSETGRVLPNLALLSDSRSTQAVATVLSWLMPDSKIRAFPIGELSTALAWLGLAQSEHVISGTVADLRARLQRPRTGAQGGR